MSRATDARKEQDRMSRDAERDMAARGDEDEGLPPPPASTSPDFCFLNHTDRAHLFIIRGARCVYCNIDKAVVLEQRRKHKAGEAWQ